MGIQWHNNFEKISTAGEMSFFHAQLIEIKEHKLYKKIIAKWGSPNREE